MEEGYTGFVSIPYGKGKETKPLLVAAKGFKAYQFPMGKVKEGKYAA